MNDLLESIVRAHREVGWLTFGLYMTVIAMGVMVASSPWALIPIFVVVVILPFLITNIYMVGHEVGAGSIWKLMSEYHRGNFQMVRMTGGGPMDGQSLPPPEMFLPPGAEVLGNDIRLTVHDQDDQNKVIGYYVYPEAPGGEEMVWQPVESD